MKMVHPMIFLIGLCILGVAVLVAVLGVGTNSGDSHLVGGDFALFGQHVTGLSTGQLFLCGIVVGLVAALGLSILRGFFARGLASRGLQRELKKSRAESAALKIDLDRLNKELEAVRVQNLSQTAPIAPPVDDSSSSAG